MLQHIRTLVASLLRNLFSLFLWLAAFWFLAAAYAVLLHPTFSSWHALPHLFGGTLALILASRRLLAGWRSSGRFGKIFRLLVALLTTSGLVLTGVGYGYWNTVANPPEFENVIGKSGFDVVQWQIQTNAEDFAEFATFWFSDLRLAPEEQLALVEAYFSARGRERTLERRYDHEGLTSEESAELVQVKQRRRGLQRRVEIIVSEQIGVLFEELGLDIPLWQKALLAVQRSEFRFVPRLPMLVVAERDTLTVYERFTLDPELSLTDRDVLENSVADMDYSAYIVDLSGQSTSPSLVVPGSLQATLRTIAHEKIHIWFEYTAGRDTDDPEQRIIEETAASLLGDAIGDIVYCRYYEPDACAKADAVSETTSGNPDQFDRRAALRETYLAAEQMLNEGRVADAEAYMEKRRVWMCTQGFCLRVLNQAYFAFHGAYADSPAFAETNCGIGEKIQELWERSGSATEFFRVMTEVRTRAELEIELYGALDPECTP